MQKTLHPLAAHGRDSLCHDDYSPIWLQKDRQVATASALNFLNSISLQAASDADYSSKNNHSRHHRDSRSSTPVVSPVVAPLVRIPDLQLDDAPTPLMVHFQDQPSYHPHRPPSSIPSPPPLPPPAELEFSTTTQPQPVSHSISAPIPPTATTTCATGNEMGNAHEAPSSYFVFPPSTSASSTHCHFSGPTGGLPQNVISTIVSAAGQSRRPSVSRNIAAGGPLLPRGLSEPYSNRQPSAAHLHKRQVARRKAAVEFLSSITFGTQKQPTDAAPNNNVLSGISAVKTALTGEPPDPGWRQLDQTPLASGGYGQHDIPVLVIPPPAFDVHDDGLMTSKTLTLSVRGQSSDQDMSSQDIKQDDEKKITDDLLPDFSNHIDTSKRGKRSRSKAHTVRGQAGRKSRRPSISPRSERPRSRKNSGHGDAMPETSPTLVTIFSSVESYKSKETPTFASPPFLTRAQTYPVAPGQEEDPDEWGPSQRVRQQPTFTSPPYSRARVKEWEKSLIDKGLLNSRIYICNKFQSTPMIVSSILTLDRKTESQDDAHPVPFEKAIKHGAPTRDGVSYADMLPPRDYYGPVESDNYDPYLLDDHTIQSGKHRVVLNLPGMMASVISFVKEKDLRGELNSMFRAKHEWLRPEITLSKIAKCKELLLDVGADLHLELSTVALAYVYFEKLVLQDVVTKLNRKLCAGSCILLAFKYNEDTILAVQKKESKQLMHVPKNMTLVEWKRKQRLKQVFNGIEKFLYVKKVDLMKNEFRLLLFLGLSAQIEPEKIMPHYNYLKQRLDVTDQSNMFDL